MFDNRKILLLSKQTFCMFSLCALRFVVRSRDLDVLCAQRIMGFTHKSMGSENPLIRILLVT